jgi:hypothetical protein
MLELLWVNPAAHLHPNSKYGEFWRENLQLEVETVLEVVVLAHV